MAYTKTDELFIEEFQKQYIAHLSKPYDPLNDENAAQHLLIQASPGDFGKISRIFDQLAGIPSVSREEFHARMAEAGSIEVYMRPIIDKVAELLLTPDKSKLKDEVIQAIGVGNYCRLVQGKNISEQEDRIKIVANIDPDVSEVETIKAKKRFVQAERNLAASCLQSILACYSAAIYQNNVLSQEKTRGQLGELIKALKNKIQIVDESVGKGFFPNGWQHPEWVSDKITLSEFDEEAIKLMRQGQSILEEDSPDKAALWKLLTHCDALYDRGKELLHESNTELTRITDLLQNLGFRIAKNGGSIFDLKEVKIPTPLELKEKINVLTEMLTLSETKIAVLSPLSQPLAALKQDLIDVKSHLDLFEKDFAHEINNNLVIPGFDEDVLRRYNESIVNFLRAVDTEAVKNNIQPYEMFILKRIVNVLSGGFFFSDERRLENQSIGIKNELLQMRETFSDEAASVEPPLL